MAICRFKVGDIVRVNKDGRIGMVKEVYDGTDPWSGRDLAPDILVDFGKYKEVIEQFNLTKLN